MKPCKSFSVGKANQNNVSNNSDHDSAKQNAEQIFINISSVRVKNYGTLVQSKQHWRIMVDEQTSLKFTKFFSTKNVIIEPTLEQIEKW